PAAERGLSRLLPAAAGSGGAFARGVKPALFGSLKAASPSARRADSAVVRAPAWVPDPGTLGAPQTQSVCNGIPTRSVGTINDDQRLSPLRRVDKGAALSTDGSGPSVGWAARPNNAASPPDRLA